MVENQTVPNGYKMTEVGIIPEDWKVQTIGEAYEICNNLRLPLSDAVRKKMQGRYPYYGPTRVQDYINEYRVEGEYALIGEDGDHFLKWETTPMTQLAKGKFNVNNHAHLIKGIKNETTWFFYYFHHRDITMYLSRQGANRYKLSKASLLELPMALPPTKEEQSAIATALSDMDDLITGQEKLIAKKRAIKTGAMQNLLNPYDSNGDLKDGWVEKSLGEVFNYQNGTALESYFNETDGYKVISIGNYSPEGKFVRTDSYIDRKFRPEVSKFIVNRNELTMILNDKTSVGTIIGRVLLIDEDDEFVFNQRTMRLSLKVDGNVRFFYFLINSNAIHNEIVGLAKPGTQIYVNTDDITTLKLQFPKEQKEQTRLTTILSDIDAEITAGEAKLAKLRQLKAGMMQELLTGKTRLV